MKCPLCGGTHFREDADGQWCRNCGASMSGPPSDNWSPFFDSALDAERREDEAQMRDYLAPEGIGRDRADGGW